MLGLAFPAVIGLSLLIYFIIIPVINYFRDPKGLRRYPNLSVLSGVTDLAFVWESQKGFRSKALLEAHKHSPVVRIGPNSLSYGDIRAIKVRSLSIILHNHEQDVAGHGEFVNLLCSSDMPILSRDKLIWVDCRIYTATIQNVVKTLCTQNWPGHIATWQMLSTSRSMPGNERSCRVPTQSRI